MESASAFEYTMLLLSLAGAERKVISTGEGDYLLRGKIMAEEFWDELETHGITLVELHQLLEVVFYNSYFVFNQKLYQQCVGLFMGCSPSPTTAVIRHSCLYV